MAPRSAKAKKAVDVKLAENDAPKKGRGKGKNVIEPEPEVADVDLDDKPVAVAEKKTVKRGNNKTTNDDQPSDKNNEVAVPAKKGRKKKVESGDNEDKPASNGDQSTDESSSQVEESEQNDEILEANGHTDEAPSSGRGRKKQAKPAAEKPETKLGRGRKNAKPEVSEDTEEAVEEKPKSGGRGKGQKTAKVDIEQEDGSDIVEEEEKPKGRKRAPPKKVEEDVDNEEQQEEEEEKPEPKRKEPKAKKGKKAQLKEDAEVEEENETSSKKRKVNKKEEKAKDEEDAPDAKPAKGKRGQKKAAEPIEADDAEPTTKRRRKAAEEKATEDSNKTALSKKKSLTDFESLNFSNASVNTNGKQWNFKISSWNVGGIRAWLSKGCVDYLKYEKPDILCLQEVKCGQDKLPKELTNIPGYHAYWLAGEKDGYAGVGFYTTKLAMNVTYGLQNEELDTEGRLITAEYEQFYLVCTYVPNSGRKLVTLPKRLQWNEEFRKYVKELDKKKPVIICGDMNVSHKEIDLANPKTNRKNAGFTDEERQGMSELLGDGFVDTFRHLYPDKTDAYTFWTYMSNSRARNVGWRLDYFIISERLLPSLCDNVIRDEVYGSDHCPLSLFLHLSSADKPKE
ncbi:unnamed protein product [Arctia plantaginis]|uniref:DNA-(apurinic or apyrimidinic site) endonuclease n=1 Tax=Arctia plantaginis TaxID=874455 RepID=A0A8S0Z6V2_ARCPL|nr:unnamed protein product [Arctia plantaginis]